MGVNNNDISNVGYCFFFLDAFENPLTSLNHIKKCRDKFLHLSQLIFFFKLLTAQRCFLFLSLCYVHGVFRFQEFLVTV